MRVAIVLIIALFATACVPPEPQIDPELEPYVKEFQLDFPGAEIDFDIVLDDLSEYAGMCFPGGDLVVIQRSWWEREDNEYDKLSIIYHELTHCAFNVSRHSHDPESIMFSHSAGEYMAPSEFRAAKEELKYFIAAHRGDK